MWEGRRDNSNRHDFFVLRKSKSTTHRNEEMSKYLQVPLQKLAQFLIFFLFVSVRWVSVSDLFGFASATIADPAIFPAVPFATIGRPP